MVCQMRRMSVVVLCLAAAGVASAQEVQTPARAIPGRYIVVLNDQQVARAGVRPLVETLARQYSARVAHVYEHTITGFAAAMSATSAAALARHPGVRYVEQDSQRFITATETNATWGLDRIDQRALPLSGSYTYDSLASNVSVYVLDTGIRATHVEFGARVSTLAFTTIDDGNGISDCNGHGTHVAGTIGGKTYGVAKGVTIHAVRVLGCDGSGTNSGVIAGVDWVTANRTLPAVANMSLSGSASTALDDAVRRSVASGVTYAIAAGNGTVDACTVSPGRVSQAITVGSSTKTDTRSGFSNYGTCVDIFAPGSGILSAWGLTDTALNTISGTSMAAPHVAGVAALFLSDNPTASPSAVHAAIVNNATLDELEQIGVGSPNRLLYSGFASTPADTPPAAGFTVSCSGRTCSFTSTSTDDRGIARSLWEFGDNASDNSGPTVAHTYASDGTFTARLTVTDTASQSDSESQSMTVIAGGAPCTACRKYTGALSGTGDSDLQPGKRYFSSGPGVHRGWLRGPAAADFDLYLEKWSGRSWVIVARSESSTSEEQIAYNGTSGYYRWRVFSDQGSGGYSLWLQRP